MSAAPVSIIGLLLLVIVLALPVVLVLIVAKLLRTKPSELSDGGHCGRCGYLVRGISSLECPECGCDLREVGIVTSINRRPHGAFLGVSVLWLIVMAVVTALFMQLAIATVTRQQMIQRTIFVQAPYWNTTIDALQQSRDKVALSAPSTGKYLTPSLTWDTAANEYHIGTNPVQQNLNAAAILIWMNQCGITVQNPQDAQTLATADVVIAAAREVAAGTPSSFMTGSHVTAHPSHATTIHRPRSGWIVLSIAMLPVLLTIAGLLWLHHRLRPQWWEPTVVGVVGLFMLAIVAILALRF